MREVGRKPRRDKKHRFVLRMDRTIFNQIRVIAFNSQISINKAVNLLLIAALESPQITDAIAAAHPPGRDRFIYIEDDFEDRGKW